MIDTFPQILTRWPIWKLGVAAFCMGATSALAMPPFSLWPLLFLTFTVLVWLFDAVYFPESARAISLSKRAVRFAFIGWAFGTGYFLAGIYWLGYSFLSNPSPLPHWAVVIELMAGVVALCAALAIFYALAGAICAVLWRPGYARLAAFAFAFFIAEMARSYLLTGFPWNLFGLALASNEVQMQAAAFIGVNGLTLAALLIFPSPAAAWANHKALKRRWRTPMAIAACVLVAAAGGGLYRLRSAPPAASDARVRIVQPNIRQLDKWNAANRSWIFQRSLDLSRSGTGGEDISKFDYVIWPESSVPFLMTFNSEYIYTDMSQRLTDLIPDKTTLIAGAERAEGRRAPNGAGIVDKVFNSVFVIGASANVEAVYDKVHLVPFGEYVPLGWVLKAFGFPALSHQVEGFQAGSRPREPLSIHHGVKVTPSICYEIIFTGAVTDAKKRPAWIVNVTNDAWFGPSTGPYQHLQQVRLRAVEEGIPVIRSANTGISAIIDPYGRIIDKLDLGMVGVVDGYLPHELPYSFFVKWRMPIFILLFLFPLQLYLVFAVIESF